MAPGLQRALAALRAVDPRGFHPRIRLGLIVATVLSTVATFAACEGCRGPTTAVTVAAPGSASGAREGVASRPAVPDAGSLGSSIRWSSAKDGDAEDLAALAEQEGPVGLEEAAADDALRPTAIRAMAYARGWSQLPFLAKASAGKDEKEARLALDATVELAARPRHAEDPEDAEELREGCELLVTLARDAARPRGRRVAAVRALRMMPCPALKSPADLPADLDAK